MSIRTVCANGHKLKIKNKYAGKAGSCPVCGARMRVPLTDGEFMDSSISGESIAVGPEIADAPPADSGEQ